MWTAPGLQEGCSDVDRSDCDHMSGLLRRPQTTAPPRWLPRRECQTVRRPPSLDLGEATDKGSINQRMVLKARAALVDELYARTASRRVIAIDER